MSLRKPASSSSLFILLLPSVTEEVILMNTNTRQLSIGINPALGGTLAGDSTLSQPTSHCSFLGLKTSPVLSHLHLKPAQKSNFLKNKNLNILPSISVSNIWPWNSTCSSFLGQISLWGKKKYYVNESLHFPHWVWTVSYFFLLEIGYKVTKHQIWKLWYIF